MSDATPNPVTHIALFQCMEVRRAIHNNELWFVIRVTRMDDTVQI